MKEIKVRRASFVFEHEVAAFFEEHVTKFGNGAKIDCSKKYLGKKVYVLVCKNDSVQLLKSGGV
jgi:putative transposon-encoded protein